MSRNSILLTLCFFTTSALAEVRPTIVLSGGVALASGLESSTEFTVENSHYDYTGDDTDATRGVFGGFVGGEFALADYLLMQLGPAYYQFSNLPVKGTLVQDVVAHPTEEYQYEYIIDSYQFLLETKILLQLDRLYPYISAGAGVSLNRSQSFTAEPESIDYTAASPSYSDRTRTAFTYQVGAGIDYDIIPYLRLGVGYRYTHLGNAELGTGELAGVNIAETLNSVDIQAQEIIAQLTYFTK